MHWASSPKKLVPIENRLEQYFFGPSQDCSFFYGIVDAGGIWVVGVMTKKNGFWGDDDDDDDLCDVGAVY